MALRRDLTVNVKDGWKHDAETPFYIPPQNDNKGNSGGGSGQPAQAVQTQETAKAPNVTRADLGAQAPTWNYNGQAPAFDYNGQAPANYDPANDAAYQNAMATLQAAKANLPEYSDPYGEDINNLYERITGRGDFQYDLEGDPLYQQYRALYLTQGQQAMQDTMGQAAALTGGYGSSYGQSVGQQQYNAYLQRLNEVAPELYDRAYQRWLNEGDQLTNQLQLARGLQSDAYGRYRDEISDYWQNVGYADADAERAYNRGVDSWQRDRSLEDTAYQRANDQWARDYQLDNDAYQRAADQWSRDYTLYGDAQQRQEDEYSRLTQMMQMGYTPTEEDLIAAGMTGAEAQTWLDYIAQQQAAAGAGGGGGGGGGNETTTASNAYNDLKSMLQSDYYSRGNTGKQEIEDYMDYLQSSGVISASTRKEWEQEFYPTQQETQSGRNWLEVQRKQREEEERKKNASGGTSKAGSRSSSKN